MAVFRDKALEPVANTKDIFDTIDMVQFKHNRPDNVVQSGAQSPTGDHRAFEFAGVKINFFPGACLFKTEYAVFVFTENTVNPDINADSVFIFHKPGFAITGYSLGNQG